MSNASAAAPSAGTTAELEQQLERLRRALGDEARRADVLGHVAAAIAGGGDVDAVAQAAVDGGVELSGAAYGAFVFNDLGEGPRPAVHARAGEAQSPFAAMTGAGREPLLAEAIGDGGVFLCEDLAQDPRLGHLAPSAPGLRAFLAAPVTSRSGAVLGGILLGHPEPGAFPERLKELMSGLAVQSGVAIEGVRLHASALREIQERRRAEAALADSEDRFHLIADKIPILCWMSDADGRIVWFNRRWYEYTGVSPAEGDGLGWRAAHDPAVLPEVDRRWAEARVTGAPIEMVFPLRGADGVYRPFLTRMEPSKDASGRIVRWFGVNVDVTGETSARERLRFALEAGRLGAWELDVETRVYEASDMCKANYGRAPDEPFGFDDLVASIHPDDRERMLSAMEAAIRTGAEYDIEYRVVLPSGAVRWMHARGRAAQTADHGGVRRMAGVSLDVTERKHGEERQRLLLNELNHRVKNTLATVQSIASQTLRNAVEPSAFRIAFEARLLALSQTHNLLTNRNWEGASLRDILTLELKPHAGGREDGGARVEVLMDRDVHLSATAAVSLGMAIHELATNAVKYGALSTPRGRVRIGVAVERGEGGPEQLALDWRESGGPTVEPPRRRGFGGRVLEKGLAAELGGEVRLDYRAEGLFCRMRLPLHALEAHK